MELSGKSPEIWPAEPEPQAVLPEHDAEQEEINVSQIGGRLRHFVREWEKITNDDIVLNYLRGYKLVFNDKVVQREIPKTTFQSKAEENNCHIAILKLLNKGAIRECQPCPDQFISPYFLTPKPDGSYRFILNLKGLNKYIDTQHFKLEDMRSVLKLLRQDCFMATLDLEDAYLLVPIHRESTRYLRFIFRDKLFEFVALPFGLCVSPYIYTKLCKPLVRFLRIKGFIIIVYLDDWWIMDISLEECIKRVDFIVCFLQGLGFIVNQKKSVLCPSHRVKFLGFILDSSEMTLELTQDKRSSIAAFLQRFLSIKSCKIEDFASLIGKLTAACPAIPYGWLYTKSLERAKMLALRDNNNCYKNSMELPVDIKPDLEWWYRKIPTTRKSLQNRDFAMTIFTDASTKGWGGHNDRDNVFGKWTDQQRLNHINYLELLAVNLALLGLANNLKDCAILLRIDNTTAISYVNRMGGVSYPNLHELAKKIWGWAEDRNISLTASYIKSSDNIQADYLSRLENPDTEWSLDHKIFDQIAKRFGKPQIDLFATKSNRKCLNYVSRFPEREAVETDAFTMSWHDLKFYAFPPVSLVLRTLQKISLDRATGIVVVPDWPAQPWFPFFTNLLIEEPLVIQPTKNLISCPSSAHQERISNVQLIAGKLSGGLS